MNYTRLEMLKDENQMQIFQRAEVDLDENDLYRGEVDFRNLYEVLRQYLCVISLSVGFEQGSMIAVDLLVDIVVQYIWKLAKSFVTNSLLFKDSFTTLQRSLHENGQSVSLLWQYLYENYSYSRKLISVNEKIEKVLAGLKDSLIVDEDLIAGEDGFVAGGLISNFLDEDMFGFDSMGLGNMKIPAKLLKRKLNNQSLDTIDYKIYQVPFYNEIDPLNELPAYQRFFEQVRLEEERMRLQAAIAQEAVKQEDPMLS
eukprot:NODE_405_length_7994_cov_0.788600.p4 type:complete len:256 gc:universal NODE_405_length_7994_cov_0.788600:6832-6065(-)